MAMNNRMSIRTEIYCKAAVSDPDNMYFHQVMKENDATHFLKEDHKDFSYFLNKGTFELLTRSRVPEGETTPPTVWAMKQK